MSAFAEQDWLSDVGPQVFDFFAEIGVPLPTATGGNVAVRCFANPTAHSRDDRNPSCSVSLTTGAWNCKACGAKGNAFHAAQVMGYSDVRARQLARSFGLWGMDKKPADEKPKERMPNIRELTKWRDELQANEKVLRRIERVKGWTRQGLWRCGVGWDGERFTFRIRDRKLKRIGVVRYLPGGRPKSLAAGKRDLFPPPEVTSRARPVFVVEGEPAVVSVWSCGFQAVGVPGANSWRWEWGARFANRRVVVLADCDRQGRELAEKVVSCIPKSSWVDLEPGRNDGWDVGDLVLECCRGGGRWQAERLLGGLL